jgi:hypothetical protein
MNLAFHKHLDMCERCRNCPFNLCTVGAKLLQEGAGIMLQDKQERAVRPIDDVTGGRTK